MFFFVIVGNPDAGFYRRPLGAGAPEVGPGRNPQKQGPGVYKGENGLKPSSVDHIHPIQQHAGTNNR